MPRPQTSVRLLDPERFASELEWWRSAEGRTERSLNQEPLSLRVFGERVDLSAPSVLAHLSGQCQFIRVRTLRDVLAYQGRIARKLPEDERLWWMDRLIRAGGGSVDLIIYHFTPENALGEVERAIGEASWRESLLRSIEDFDSMLAESCVLPAALGIQDLRNARGSIPGPTLRDLRLRNLAAARRVATMVSDLRAAVRPARGATKKK